MRPSTSRGIGLLALGISASIGLASCSSGTTTSTSATTAAPTAVSSTAAGSGSSGTAAAGGAATTASGALKKVNANTATVAELEAAFTANGVTNAAKWAREVEEYRPYAADDPSFASLKKNLAKYNPSPEVLQKILASLSL